jgi:hypothetical protein
MHVLVNSSEFIEMAACLAKAQFSLHRPKAARANVTVAPTPADRPLQQQRRNSLHMRFSVRFPGQHALKLAIFFNNLTKRPRRGPNFAYVGQVLKYPIFDISTDAAVSDGVTLLQRHAAR